MNKKVLLINAGAPGRRPNIALSCPALASWIRKFGYQPYILDMRVQDYRSSELLQQEYLCAGVSTMTGSPLKYAKEISVYLKKKYPEMPVVWGGTHPSAVPEETVRADFVDAVVAGEGEKAFIRLLEDLEAGNLKSIYQQEVVDIAELDFPAYDLIDVEKYMDYYEGWNYEVSRGCPHRCKFCYVWFFHDRRWRMKPVKKILKEIEQIVQKYDPPRLRLMGDNVFVNKEQIFEVADGIAHLGRKWSGLCRVDYVSDYTDEDMRRLKRSNLYELWFGCESGDPETLKYIKKDITVAQSIGAVKKCVAAGITPYVSLVIGFPEETRTGISRTLDLYDRLISLGAVVNSIFVFTPYPGTPFFLEAVEKGYSPPGDIDGWASFQNQRTRLPWHGSLGKELEAIHIISRFKFFVRRIKNFSRESLVESTGLPYLLFKLGTVPFEISMRVRWKYRFFKLAYEWRLFRFMVKKVYPDII